MRSSSQCEHGAAQSQSAMSPAHNSALMLAVLFISFIPITTGVPVLLNPSSIEHEQLLTQITDLCSFYLSADPSFRTSDVLEDLCFLMLGSLQKSEEITARETSKRDELQGPGRIQSRGYFLYRPRNGRRSDEYV
ncbi:neuromedin-U isoform X1 [Puntigrus tetrazona]|uniref:neuromedin-U isoform X1 n=1 Tax=Puntigrus tetrazona TaxID=1606681 RepID=UPI001C8901CA|nr:neuromedin-U isoform X1 [Puntigrus tetrazona]XP_043093528.1 neuromedin-U isoform X1 [Puntigrus tetrazona]